MSLNLARASLIFRPVSLHCLPGKKSVYCPQLETKANELPLRVSSRRACARDRASHLHNRGHLEHSRFNDFDLTRPSKSRARRGGTRGVLSHTRPPLFENARATVRVRRARDTLDEKEGEEETPGRNGGVTSNGSRRHRCTISTCSRSH